jgi:hypothetical protein
MTKYSRNGNKTFLILDGDQQISSALEKRNYVLNVDQFGNFFLKDADDFTNPSRVYGDTYAHADRILNTYASRKRNTGVLLRGEKGSGKTLLAREVCIRSKHLYPTIIIDQPYSGDGFNLFLRSIKEPVIIFIDEFEKVYGCQEDQESLLSLLDGTLSSNKLFMFTCNDMDRVNDYLKNRPGRMFYDMPFATLEESSIIEYINENMRKESEREMFITRLCTFSRLTFDMLVAIIEEKNRYDEPFEQIMNIVNVEDTFQYTMYEVDIAYRGNLIPKEMIQDRRRSYDLGNEVLFSAVYSYYPKKGTVHRPHVQGIVDNREYKFASDEIDPSRVKRNVNPDVFDHTYFEGIGESHDEDDYDEDDVEFARDGRPVKSLVSIRFGWDNFNRSKSSKNKYVFNIEDYEITLTYSSFRSYNAYE